MKLRKGTDINTVALQTYTRRIHTVPGWWCCSEVCLPSPGCVWENFMKKDCKMRTIWESSPSIRKRQALQGGTCATRDYTICLGTPKTFNLGCNSLSPDVLYHPGDSCEVKATVKVDGGQSIQTRTVGIPPVPAPPHPPAPNASTKHINHVCKKNLLPEHVPSQLSLQM